MTEPESATGDADGHRVREVAPASRCVVPTPLSYPARDGAGRAMITLSPTGSSGGSISAGRSQR